MRGTTNRNARGNSESRRRRKLWLMKEYGRVVAGSSPRWMVPCYRCKRLLMYHEITVDRVTPGCHGGTYRRDNIRPACARCNSETGGAIRAKKKRRQGVTPAA